MTVLSPSVELEESCYIVSTHGGKRQVLHAMAVIVRRRMRTGAWIGHGGGIQAMSLDQVRTDGLEE